MKNKIDLKNKEHKDILMMIRFFYIFKERGNDESAEEVRKNIEKEIKRLNLNRKSFFEVGKYYPNLSH